MTDIPEWYLDDKIPTYRAVPSSDDVLDAFHRVGAVRLLDAVPENYASAFYREALRLFHQPQAIKDRLKRTGLGSGFTPAGVEGVRGGLPNPHRSFLDLRADLSDVRRLEEEFPLNMFLASKVLRQIQDLAMDVLNVGWPDVANLAEGGEHMFRITHYPSGHAGKELFPSHRDFGLITCYLGGAERGLKFYHGSGFWDHVRNDVGSIVVTAGTTLCQYDRDCIAIQHAAYGYLDERISAVLFTEPRGDVVLPNGKTAREHLTHLTSQIRKDP